MGMGEGTVWISFWMSLNLGILNGETVDTGPEDWKYASHAVHVHMEFVQEGGV
jgi:hypothetical protein